MLKQLGLVLLLMFECFFFYKQKADELPSTGLVFESLCQFFSDVEPSALLNLPTPGECIKSAETLQVILSHCHPILYYFIIYSPLLLIISNCTYFLQNI